MAADKSFEWISMSLGKARWIPFNVDKEIARIRSKGWLAVFDWLPFLPIR